MKPELAASLVAAFLLHALLLFGFRLETPARPLAVSDQPVDVSLVAPPPEPAPPVPASTPEPTPEPQPTPDIPTPAPTPEQETIPAPDSIPNPKPIPHHSQQHPHTAPAGPASHNTPTAALTSQPYYLSNPRPEYPAEAHQMHQEGVVLLNVEVGTDGRADDVTLARSSGFPSLDRAAIDAVRRWRFAPAEAAGIPVTGRALVPVRFTLPR